MHVFFSRIRFGAMNFRWGVPNGEKYVFADVL